jgi:DNA polymerase-3 subunit alpha
VESIGLLKLDFLGLATLTQMRKAAELIEARHGTRLDLDNIPTDDPCIFDLLTNGEVVGVFQVESGGMKKTLAQMRPTCLEDIIAVVSLYRPGPMQFIDSYCRRKHGEEDPEYIHPALKPILEETYGVIVYQEQIIRIMRDLAGYSGGQADVIRRAISKKKDKLIAEHRIKFRKGCEANGIPGDKADEIYAAIEYFANYGFNKAHAADYAVITCQTAYLKAKYPVEYMAALLTVEQDNTDKVSTFLAECRRLHIPVLPPDVNASHVDFTIQDAEPDQELGRRPDTVCARSNGAIRFGLGGIKNVSATAVYEIIQARAQGEPFADLDDFCARVDLRRLNRRTLECLIKAGALDRFGTRSQLLAAIDQMMSVSSQIHRAAEVGQLTMFDMFGGPEQGPVGGIVLPEGEPLSRKEMLNWEKELVGFYVSEHPLHQVAVDLQDTITCFCGEVGEEMNGQTVVLAGIVSWIRPHVTKRGAPMAFVHLEDIQGGIEVVVFPRTYEATREIWQQDKILIVRGRVDAERGEPKLLCESVRDHVVVARPLDPGETPAAVDAPRDREERAPAAPAQPAPVQPAPAQPAPAGPAYRAPRHLNIVLHRTGDRGQDEQRARQVYTMLQGRPGSDHFTFIVVNGAHRVQIDFPNATTDCSPDLARSLQAMLGRDAVQVV